MTMTSTESVSDQVQLGRVTMYKKEGSSSRLIAANVEALSAIFYASARQIRFK